MMGIIRESDDPEGKYPSSRFYSSDVPVNANILLDDTIEVIVFIKPLYAFDLVFEHITYDEHDKLKAAGIMGSCAGTILKTKIFKLRRIK